jgi:hypothetical protein
VRRLDANEVNFDAIIDGEKFLIDHPQEFEYVEAKALNHRGVTLVVTKERFAFRFWSKLSGEEQEKFEKSKFAKTSGANFARHRAKGAE